MKFYQISLHSHLSLNLMNVTRWQAMPGKASSRQFKKKKKEQLYLFLSSTHGKEGPLARCLSLAYEYNVSTDL